MSNCIFFAISPYWTNPSEFVSLKKFNSMVWRHALGACDHLLGFDMSERKLRLCLAMLWPDLTKHVFSNLNFCHRLHPSGVKTPVGWWLCGVKGTLKIHWGNPFLKQPAYVNRCMSTDLLWLWRTQEFRSNNMPLEEEIGLVSAWASIAFPANVIYLAKDNGPCIHDLPLNSGDVP